jgi:AcrR family transcriptional regulator
VFAQKGFYGSSMREIAKAADVSEALIYQHFPSKDALYGEIYFYIDSQIEDLCRYFKDAEPSTEALVRIVYGISNMILLEIPSRREEQKMFERLLAYSLLENPKFAKTLFQKYDNELTPLWMASIASAQDTGDMYRPLVEGTSKMWLFHHLAMAINFLNLSGEMLFPYKGSTTDFIEAMVLFILRGIGLTDDAVKKYSKMKISEQVQRELFYIQPE